MDQPRVRAGDASDVAAIARLILEVQALHVRHEPTIFREPASAEVEAWVKERLAEGWRATLAEVGGEIVGYVLVELSDRPAGTFTHASHVAYVHQIGVDDGHRGRGVGRVVLEAACDDAADSGATRVGLDTWSFNDAARAFFRSQGFETSNVRLRREL